MPGMRTQFYETISSRAAVGFASNWKSTGWVCTVRLHLTLRGCPELKPNKQQQQQQLPPKHGVPGALPLMNLAGA